jgi:glycosyltransferase involved in cell wall biosynthesis
LKSNAVRERLFPVGAPQTRAAHWIKAQIQWLGRWQGPEVLDLGALKSGREGLRFLVITACPGASRRYRCEHLAEFIRGMGGSAAILEGADRRLQEQFDDIIDAIDVLVFQRVKYHKRFERMCRIARSKNVKTVFETDDLIFDSSANVLQSGAKVYLRARDISRYRQMLDCCEGALTSTMELKKALESTGKKQVWLLRNGYGQALDRYSRAALKAKAEPSTKPLCLGFASGTPTHDRDFALIAPILSELISQSETLRLTLIGYITVPQLLRPHASKIDCHRAVPWQDLPRHLAKIDINLAPFVTSCPFNRGKSAVKFLEAALLACPTIASPLPAYRHAASLGDGLRLAQSQQEWSKMLRLLIGDEQRRRTLGQAARSLAMTHYSPARRQAELEQLLSQ